MNGIINVYKEQGYTSHDVVAKLRGILHMKKIGHTGTLDPDAVGVLPVCLGRGTKLCGMITDWGKTYEAVMLLGVKTDTQDISGTVLQQSEVTVNEVEILDAIQSFVGEYAQIPPMYSALKHNGKKLYELARNGIEVERQPRNIQIYAIHVNEMNLEEEQKTVTFTVECSKGTYIRTLCEDIGAVLGCGACMMQLKRTRVGRFSINESLTLSQIEQLVKEEQIDNKIIPIDEMFADKKKVVVREEGEKFIYNGNRFSIELISDETRSVWDSFEQVRVYDKDGTFIGIYELKDEMFAPVKMFLDRQ